MDENQGTRRNGPMVVLLAVLAMLGIRSFTPESASPSGERAKSEEVQALREAGDESGRTMGAARSDLERFAQTLRGSREVKPINGLGDKQIKKLSDIEEVTDFMEKEDLRCIIACVPDPVDSGSGDRFDTLIDAIQRAAETQEYVLDRFYYPWQKVKEPSRGLHISPLEVTSKETQGISKQQASLSLQLQTPSEERPWKDLPGILLFHTPPDSHPRWEYHPELLLIFLVGETATAGLRKDAFMTSLELIKRSKEYCCGFNGEKHERPTRKVDILGPCFSGSQVSLEKIIQQCAKNQEQGSKLCFNLISGHATAIEQDRLQRMGNEKMEVKFRATIVPEHTVIDVLMDYLGHPEDVAMLCESNTDYGHKMNQKWQDEHGLTQFPFPLHIAAVRAAYEKSTGATKNNTFRLPSFGSRLQLHLKGTNSTRETEPSMAPEMTAATTERTLADMLGTIARERFRYVFILATDIKDELFLATLVRDYCPDSRLVFTDTDLLLAHPDFSANLRGSIVGSSYPLHFRNQNWSYPFQGGKERFTFPGPREQGCYNAMIALLNEKDSKHFLEYGPPFQNAPDTKRFPPVWISIVGEGGLYPLKAVQRLDRKFRDYVLQAEGPDESSSAQELNATFKPLHRALLIVPVLAFSLLLLCLGWMYGSGVQEQATSSEKKNLFSPRVNCRNWQLCYVFACLASVFLVYWYLTFIWLIPVYRWLLQNKNTPLEMPWWKRTLPFLLIIVLPLAFIGLIRWWRGSAQSTQGRRWRVRQLCIILLAAGSLMATILAFIPIVNWLPQNENAPVRMESWNLIAPFILTIGVPLAFVYFVWDWLRSVCWLVIFLFAGLITCWVYHSSLWGTWQNGEDLLFFERATNLANGVTPVVPIVMLGIAISCWAYFQLKRLYLLEEWAVVKPFPRPEKSLLRFQEVNKHHDETDKRLGAPWRDVKWYSAVIAGIVLAFICCRLYIHYVPPVEAKILANSLPFALAGLAVLIVCGWVHMRKVWESVRKLLHAITQLPLEKAFAHIPPAVTNMFGPNLTSERPGRQGHLHYQREQHNLLTKEYPQIAKDMPNDVLPTDLKTYMKSCSEKPREASKHLIETAQVCLRMLDNIWNDPRLAEKYLGKVSDEASEKTSPFNNATVEINKKVHTGGAIMTIEETIKPDESNKAVQKWLARVQDFVALEVTFYLSQFFVQLRNMALFLSLAPFLLLVAATSYPFQPQRLWVLMTVVLIGLTTLSVIWIVIQIERDELVSRILKTTPNQINFRWGFMSHLLLYAIPLLGILGALSSDMSDLVHSWADPLLQILK